MPFLDVGGWSGLPRSPLHTDSLFRLHLSPGGCVVSPYRPLLYGLTTLPFWLEPIIAVGSSMVTGVVVMIHLRLAMQLLSLAPLCRAIRH